MTKAPSTPLHGIKAALGIDISKAHLDLCLLTELADWHCRRRRVPNTRAGLEDLLQWVGAHVRGSLVTVMEATGPYGDLAAHLLHQAGHRVSVVNAARIKDYAKSQGRHNKTDQVDAELIARFGLIQQLDQWQPLPEAQATLRDLLRRLQDIQDQQQAEENRLEHCVDQKSIVAGQLKTSIRWHAKQQAAMEKAIAEHLQAHPLLWADCQRLEAIHGIGQKSARWLVAELPRHLENSRAAAAWVGVAPRRCESGTLSKPARIGPAGNRYLRRALYMPAIVARHKNPRCKDFADRLAKNGKPKMAVIMAVLHKLVRTAFSLLKNQSTYDPSHLPIPVKNPPMPA